jgi:hypothetical protein
MERWWWRRRRPCKRWRLTIFQKITSTIGTRMDEILGHIDPRVRYAMNEELCIEFMSKEIVDALESIGDFKSPGLDCMHSIFYKKFRDVVGAKVT